MVELPRFGIKSLLFFVTVVAVGIWCLATDSLVVDLVLLVLIFVSGVAAAAQVLKRYH